MAQQIYSVSSTWTPVASGAGDATFEFDDHPGDWTVHNSSNPAGIVSWFSAEAMKPVSLALAAGEYLHLRGRSKAFVVATTVV